LESYSIVTFGCQMNEHDSETIAGMMEQMGLRRAGSLDASDIIILNTCCVRGTAENKAFSFLGKLRRKKIENPRLIIGVCGCMTQQEGMADRIKKTFPYVDIVLGTHNIGSLPRMIEKAVAGGMTLSEIWPGSGAVDGKLPLKRKAGVRALVTIMYGCNNFCTYCIVPYVRGRERSRSPEDVIEEVAKAGGEGYKEVVLLGQNVNSYGKDLPTPVDFARLLEMLDKVDGIERIRYMTSHPRDFNDRLIDAIAASSKVCEHFHLPVQAGSNRILKRMNRGYEREDYIRLTEKIKASIPDATVTTDIMVGFPGEEDEDFNETMDLIRRVRFDSAYTFIYNNRTGTPASMMEGQIKEEVKKARIKTLIELQKRIGLEKNKGEVGRTQDILVEGVRESKPGLVYGRNRGNKIVVFRGDNDLFGQTIPVRIVDARLDHLIGEASR